MIRKLLTALFLFLFLYSLPLKILPFDIGSRMIISILGFSTFIYFNIFKSKFSIKKQSRFFVYLNFLVILLLSLTLISSLINNTSDYSMLRNCLSFYLNYFAAYFIFILLNKNEGSSMKKLIVYLSLAVNSYLICSLFIIVSPEFKLFIFNCLDPKDFIVQQLFMFSFSTKLSGIGANPYIVGYTNAFTILFITIYLIQNKVSFKFKLYLIFSLLFILVIGNMIARTTSLGFIFAFILFLYNFISTKQINLNRSIINFSKSLVVIIALCIIPFFITDSLKKKLDSSFKYGFELVDNLLNGQGIQTKSTNELKGMYIYPNNPRTYILGDGLMVNPRNNALYYMDTDVGYLRLIYYLGILGLVLFFMIQLLPLILAYYRLPNKNLSIYLYCSTILLFILTMKGYTDLFHIFVLFYFILTQQSKKIPSITQ